MANPEDFEIIPDEIPDSPPPRRSRLWLWVAGAAVLFVFAFAVGVGWSTLTDRLGPGSATAAPVVAVTSLPGETPTSGPATSDAPTATLPEATPPETPPGAPATALPVALPATPTHTPLSSPTTPPARVCTVPLDPQFSALFDPGVLGCPTAPTTIIWAAYERFERGAMLWRSDTNLTYILYGDGSWGPSNETWDGRDVPWRGDPPSGLFRPERGFGYVWGVRDDVFTRLGWATMPEKGFCAAIQPFEQGFVLASAAVASCTPENLYNSVFDADWRPLLYVFENNGRWLSTTTTWAPGAPIPTAVSATVTPTPTLTPTAGASMRPAQNGVFTARRGQPTLLDGRFDDWPGAWIPVSAVVQGRDQWSGPSDLSAAFQVMWAPEGLYLAISINDETRRAAPDGSNLWQGDGVEMQFDRRLVDDFNDPRANDDDTQIGLAPDESFTYMRGYRWLPFSAEARFDPSGAVTQTPSQYAIEVLVPWLYFDISAAELQAGMTFGFNLSVNDNDGDTPAQQAVISASPARTTHDNPMEWGTLILAD